MTSVWLTHTASRGFWHMALAFIFSAVFAYLAMWLIGKFRVAMVTVFCVALVLVCIDTANKMIYGETWWAYAINVFALGAYCYGAAWASLRWPVRQPWRRWQAWPPQFFADRKQPCQ